MVITAAGPAEADPPFRSMGTTSWSWEEVAEVGTEAEGTAETAEALASLARRGPLARAGVEAGPPPLRGGGTTSTK